MSIIFSFIWKILSNPKVYKPLIVVLTISAFIFLWKDRNYQKSVADRQSNNVEALMKDSISFVNKYNQLVVQKDALVMTYDEFKKSKSKEIDFMKKEISASKIKIKQLYSIIDVKLKIIDSGYTYLTDTCYIDTISKKIEHLKVGSWSNTWTNVDFKLNQNYKLDFTFQTNDTVILSLYKYKEKTLSTRILPDGWVFWQDWKYAGSGNLTRPNSKLSLAPIIIK